MTFDEWNEMETRRICRGEDSHTRLHVRAARSGGMARLMFFSDYEEWCDANGKEPEQLWQSSNTHSV